MKVLFALFGLVATTVAAPSGILAGGYGYGAAPAAIVRAVPSADALPASAAGLQNVYGAIVPLDTPTVAAAKGALAAAGGATIPAPPKPVVAAIAAPALAAPIAAGYGLPAPLAGHPW